MLLALLSAQRVQRLHLLRVGCVVKVVLGFMFGIVEVIKQSRPGSNSLVLECRAYPVDRSLCLVAFLKEFLARRKFIGIIEKRLLVVSYSRATIHEPCDSQRLCITQLLCHPSV